MNKRINKKKNGWRGWRWRGEEDNDEMEFDEDDDWRILESLKKYQDFIHIPTVKKMIVVEF